MNKIFNEPGTKIKKFAVILFCVEVVASIVIAFAFGWTRQYTHYFGYTFATTRFNLFNFIVPLLGGPACAYVSNLLLYAFGELVENSEKKNSDCCCKPECKTETKEEAKAESNEEKSEESPKAEEKTTNICEAKPELPEPTQEN